MKYLNKTLLAAGVAAALPGGALAAGFGVAEQSNSALGSAFAGAGALSENASNQWYNPATLSGLEDGQLSLAAHQVMIDTSFDDANTSRPGDMEDINATVPAFYLSNPLNDRVTFGLSVNAPFGTKLEYEDNWGGDSYAQESDLQTLNVNPSLAFEVTSTLQFGIGVNYQKIEADLDNSATRLEGQDKDLGWNAGLLFRPTQNQRVGLSYRSKMDYKINGDITFYANPPALPSPPAGTYSAETNVTLPESWNLSWAGDISNSSTLLASVEHTEWSRLDSLIVNHEGPAPLPNPVEEELEWDDSQRYSLGFRHALDSGTVLRAGYAHETSAQEELRSALVPDNDRDWLTLGATFNPVEDLSVDVGYAHVMVDEAGIDRSENRDGIPGDETVEGTYELTANIIGAQLNYKF